MNPRHHLPHTPPPTHTCAACGFGITITDRDRVHLPKHYCWKCAEWLSSRQHPAVKAKKKG